MPHKADTTPEWQLAREQHVQHTSHAPNIRLAVRRAKLSKETYKQTYKQAY